MPLQATNDFVFIKRDESETEIGGLILPDSAVKKTNQGTILSAGSKVEDDVIRRGKGKIAKFHNGIGFEIEDDGESFLVLRGSEIIGIK